MKDKPRGLAPLLFLLWFLVVLAAPVSSAASSLSDSNDVVVSTSAPSDALPFCCDENGDCDDSDSSSDVPVADMALSTFDWNPPFFFSRVEESFGLPWKSISRSRIHKPPEFA